MNISLDFLDFHRAIITKYVLIKLKDSAHIDMLKIHLLCIRMIARMDGPISRTNVIYSTHIYSVPN